MFNRKTPRKEETMTPPAAPLTDRQKFAQILLEAFPWIEQEDDFGVSGADTISSLQQLYWNLKKGKAS